MTTRLRALSRTVASQLERTGQFLVLAESCTGGLIAASLTSVPGVSRFFCGSLVTYQNDTKHEWLSIPHTVLKKPGPVSKLTAQLMAESALRATPHASISAAVTGHLGPQAPAKLDGVIYVAVSYLDNQECRTEVQRYQLQRATRLKRQQAAAAFVLQLLAVKLDQLS